MCGSHLKVVLQVNIRCMFSDILPNQDTKYTCESHKKSAEMVLMHHTDFLFLFFSVLYLK